MLQEVDWPTVISGAGVFVTTCILTYKGWKDRRRKSLLKVLPPSHLMANAVHDQYVGHNTEAIRDLTQEVRRLCDLIIISRLRD